MHRNTGAVEAQGVKYRFCGSPEGLDVERRSRSKCIWKAQERTAAAASWTPFGRFGDRQGPVL